MEVKFGPCCFYGKHIEGRKTDPCSVTVEAAERKPQVWFCQAACFRTRLATIPGAPGFLDPVYL